MYFLGKTGLLFLPVSLNKLLKFKKILSNSSIFVFYGILCALILVMTAFMKKGDFVTDTLGKTLFVWDSENKNNKRKEHRL